MSARLPAGLLLLCAGLLAQPEKVVVLTFDDAVKSHRTVVAPLLKELGFGATFFVTHRWMDDPEHFLTWREIAEIHRMGFEIGNHSWTHPNFATPRNAARMAAELALVENELRKVGVPRPASFAYSGNGFGPEAVRELQALGYEFARRGAQPEVAYGKIEVGSSFDPRRHHPLLIPTTGDAYPDWTLEHFRKVVAQARGGKIAVLQFHGAPDRKHPWVHTPPERFREYMDYLKQQGFQAIALRDVQRYLPKGNPPEDPLLQSRYPPPKDGRLTLPTEMEATRADLSYWLENMVRYHRYSPAEVARVTGLHPVTVKDNPGPPPSGPNVVVLPYPGGRHPRLGFLEGAILPHRGTKASVFLPWDPSSYAVVDLPEAVFSNLGLTYLAHTHIPTIWDAQNVWLENIDWIREDGGALRSRRELPNSVAFGATIQPGARDLTMELWLRNDTPQALTKLRTQVCVMLKGAADFNSQTSDNKIFRSPVSAVRSTKADRWILTAWDRCGRTWGNPQVPCFHADPVLPDCAPGQTVRVRGRLWFYEGNEIEKEVERAGRLFTSVPEPAP